MPEQTLQPQSETEFRGVWLNRDAPQPLGALSDLRNFMIVDGKLKARPGFQTENNPSSSTWIQALGSFVDAEQEVRVFAWVDGDYWEYDSSTSSWTKAGTQPTGSWSSQGEIDWVSYRGELIFTDGNNGPLLLAPGSDVSGVSWTRLSSAPSGAEIVDVYYDKVFFARISESNVDSNTFEWSDEGDPENGYDGAGQSWEFIQRDDSGINDIVPLNNRMLIVKENSVSVLRGAVEDTFQTDAVREGVSETEGAVGLYATDVLDGDVYIASRSGPRVVRGGERMIDIAKDDSGVNRLEGNDVHGWSNFVKNGNLFRVLANPETRRVWFIAGRDGGFFDEFGDEAVVKAFVYDVDSDTWTMQTLRGGNLFVWAVVDWPGASDSIDDSITSILIGRRTSTGSASIFRFSGFDENGDPRTGHDDAGTSPDGNTTSTLFSSPRHIVESRQYGRNNPDIVKRLSEVRIRFDLPASGEMTFDLVPVVDGEYGSTSLDITIDASTEGAGDHMYRKGFNSVGRLLGWRFDDIGDENNIGVSIESSIALMTRVGSYADIQ